MLVNYISWEIYTSQSNQRNLEINRTIKLYYTYIYIFFKMLIESLQPILNNKQKKSKNMILAALTQHFTKKWDPESVDFNY